MPLQNAEKRRLVECILDTVTYHRSSLDPGHTGVEIDVMECFEPGLLQYHNVFTGGYGLDMQQIKVGKFDMMDNPEDFHRYGVLWDENGYTFYVDGEFDGHVDKNVSHRP